MGEKKLRTLNFEHRGDVERFANFNRIPKEDIVSIDRHTTLGMTTMYTLSFYADETLVDAIRYHQRIVHRHVKKEKKLLVVATFMVIVFILLATFWKELMLL